MILGNLPTLTFFYILLVYFIGGITQGILGVGLITVVISLLSFVVDVKETIIDFDVHHGNGTQDIFYENENVLFISTHQYPYYPGTGSEQERGKFNNIFNIPLPAGISSEEYLNVFDRVLKKLDEFKPEFILISAGFDAHEDDPLAQFNLKTDDYFTITKRILEASKKFCNGKVVSILEGGYDLNALRDSTKRHVDALLEFN